MAQSELEMTNSSSDDEEVSTEGSESESESGSDAQPSSTKTQAQSSSEESESDADSPPKSPEKATPTIKPLASKPMDDEPSKKPRPQNPPTKPVNGKRKAVEVHDGGKTSKITKEVGAVSAPGPENAGERKAVEVHDGGKKSKITKEVGAVSAPGPENAGEKKPMFNRLWSEDDEIVLLKGMINYVDTKGKDPMADVNDLHEFVKSSLNVDVNNAQMSAKVRRLKKKFMNNEGKIEKHGKVRSFSNPHESKLYKLSEALWGRKNNKNAAGEVDVNGGIESVKNGIRIPITDEDITTRGLELLSGPKKLELEEKWNDLKVQQQKLYLKKLELMKEEGDAVLDAMMKSNPSNHTVTSNLCDSVCSSSFRVHAAPPPTSLARRVLLSLGSTACTSFIARHQSFCVFCLILL